MLIAVPASSHGERLQELAALSRAKPLSFGTPGIGSVPHLLGELLNLEGAIRLLHVPYKGSAPAVADAVGGQIDVVLATMPSMAPFVRSGKIRGIAVTSERRSDALPEVPTLAEAGVPGMTADVWYGLFARAGTPEPALKKLQAAAAQALAQPDLIERLQKAGYDLTRQHPRLLPRNCAPTSSAGNGWLPRRRSRANRRRDSFTVGIPASGNSYLPPPDPPPLPE